MRLLIAVLALLVIVQAVEQTVTTTNELESTTQPNAACNYNGIDLSALTKSAGDYIGTDGTYDYKMNVCGASNAGSGCTDKGYAVCQFNKAGGMVAGLGKFGVDSQPTWAYIDSGNPAQGVKYGFTNGDKCWKSGGEIPRPVNIYFPCSGGTESGMTVVEDTATCTFTITLKTDKSCPGGGSGGGGSSGGLSGGSVFLIILAVVVPIYIVGGCVYKNKKLGTTGKESCPNIDFWSRIPGLAMDGCRYTMMMIQTGCKGKQSYSQV